MSRFYMAMQEVLERPQYDILTGRAVDYQQVIMEAISRAVLNLLERVRLRIPDSPVYNLEALTFFFVVAVALLLLGTSMGVTYVILKYRRKRVSHTASVAAIFDDIANKKFSLSDLLGMSQKYAEKDQLRDAVRYYYMAVLVALDDRRTIRVDKSKTNAQLARELSAAAPYLSEAYLSVVGVFEESWFGKKKVDEGRYRHFAAYAEEILRK